MPRKAPEYVVAESDRAWKRKRSWYGICAEAWWYAAPGMNPYTGGDEPGMGSGHTAGQRRHDHLFDGTLARAAERLPNRMVNELFPHGRHWADLHPGPFFLDADVDEEAEREILAMTQERVFANIHSADLSLELVSMTRDAIISGTGVLKIGISPDSGSLLHFEAVNQAEVALEAGPMGRVWGYHRKGRMRREHILATWNDAVNVPAGDPMEDREKEPKDHEFRESTYYDVQSGKWYMDVILLGADGRRGSGPVRIVEREYAVCPWIAYRYALLPGEVQGRSPVMAALPDARTLNHAKRVRLESASMRVAGMFTFLNDATFNPRTVRLQSGAFIPVGNNSRDNPTIRPLEVAGDVQLGELIIQDTVAALKETMLDFALPDATGAVRSATEIVERQAEARQQRGMPYLRLMQEVGRPLLRAATYLLQQAGQLPELSALQKPMQDGEPRPLLMDGTDIALQFVSPLVQAQRLSDAQTIVGWAESSQRAAGPEAWIAGAKTENIPAALADRMQVDESLDLVRTDRERAEWMQRQAEARAPRQPAAPDRPSAAGGTNAPVR